MGVVSDGERCGCWYTDEHCYCYDPADDGLCYCVPDCHCCTTPSETTHKDVRDAD